jgi:2',3'-cyclic-nucleotide 2'-phosphodiesterase (5'-nucleotidase family)
LFRQAKVIIFKRLEDNYSNSTSFSSIITHYTMSFSSIPSSLSNTLSQSIGSSLSFLAGAFSVFGRAGGRAPTHFDKIDASETWEPTENEPEECRLIILQITDVYTLENLAHFKTLVEDIREKSAGARVVAILTGDFLSPYLLSTVDYGFGMMTALNAIPLDYIIWGNHEADIEHKVVCRHVRGFAGKWINSNMLDHEAMDAQQEYDVITLTSGDGTHTRKIGLCAVLSDDPKLYEHFKEPGAFGGATITDPWEALTKYKKILEEDEGCDLVVPLQHLYIPDDHKTCENFDFPVVLSGHDHHRVDEVVCGTRLIKPGMNGDYASVVEISWSSKDNAKPKIRSRFVKCQEWEADPISAEINERAYDALIPLRNTELAQVHKSFEPLSSNGSRSSVCTMGKYICTLIRSSLNVSRQQRKHAVDSVLLMGGNIRGNTDYPEGSFFSLEALEAEIKSDEVIAVVSMPGWLLAEGIQATHIGDPIPGWMQYDQGVVEETLVNNPPIVTHVAGEPLDKNRVYRVATKISDLTNGQSPPWTNYYMAHPELLPAKGGYINIQAELMGYFARNLWRKLWTAIAEEISNAHDMDEGNPVDYLSMLDRTGDGSVTFEELQLALRNMLGVSIDKRETTFAKFIHNYADTTGNGKINLTDIRHFVNELNYDDGDTLHASDKVQVAPDTESESDSGSNDGAIFIFDEDIEFM